RSLDRRRTHSAGERSTISWQKAAKDRGRDDSGSKFQQPAQTSLIEPARDHLRAAAEMHDIGTLSVPLDPGHRERVDEGCTPHTQEGIGCQTPRDAIHGSPHDIRATAAMHVDVIACALNPFDLAGIE